MWNIAEANMINGMKWRVRENFLKERLTNQGDLW